MLIVKQASVKEQKGAAACYLTVCPRWYFKPASGSELDEAARVGVAPDEGGFRGVMLEGHSSVSLFLQSTAEQI